MNMKRHLVYCLFAGLLWSANIAADTFAQVGYDATHDSLLATITYRGTNPNHHFSVRWGTCQTTDNNRTQLSADVLDDQWNDLAEHDFRKQAQLSLQDIPCRPAQVTLRIAPRFFTTVLIPQLPGVGE